MELFELLPYRIKKIDEIFEYYLKFSKSYLLRWNYSLQDYHKRRLQLEVPDIRYILHCCIRAWTTFIFLWILILFPDCRWIASQNCLTKIVPVEGLSELCFYVSMIILGTERLWFQSIRSLRNYTFSSNDYLSSLYTDERFNEANRQYLLRYFIYAGYFSGTIYRMFSTCIVLFYLYVINELHFQKYQNCWNGYISFIDDLYEMTRSRNMQQLSSIEFHQKFRQCYSKIFNEISGINYNYKQYFLMTEILSKTTIVFLIIYYERQTTQTIYSVVVMITVTPLFLLNTIMYLRLSYFDCYNSIIFRMLNDWSARLQWRISNKNYFKIDLMRKISTSILLKWHHFNQTISSNRIGFTCGALFYINKNKYAELLLLNIVFVLLFYKKFILNDFLR
ncbi:hypothetical protein SSS_02197 [Sarcoptes scabiei]|uniref:Gustatory receptor n=1 Tax=Sarcoptes scabiei TaxID=52283 RepID=A0A834RCC4_SARSC|nr:hypothetical protein SSS_02197 [Sarcoptes scabiei]